MNSLAVGSIVQPFINAVNKANGFIMEAGTPVILLAGLTMCIVFVILGIFTLKKSVKGAIALWAIAGIAVIVSGGWIGVKALFEDVGQEAKETDWSSSVALVSIIPVLLASTVYKIKNINK